jgi:hypothetical protein
MLEFAAVLAEVEARERDAFRDARAYRFAPAPADRVVRKTGMREAAGAYAENAPRLRSDGRRNEPPPDRAAVLAEIVAAAGDARRLRTLRRRLALRLHPDRIEGGNAILLAECNAAIDAALRD